ncbi:AAA family ATPase [Streptomyces sp. NPDC059009]|uniref:AAA family ATPase n=1 Tax=Streptomyces sp. NPDC059009 TaxID=3346694 RepID=UPI0036A9C9C2
MVDQVNNSVGGGARIGTAIQAGSMHGVHVHNYGENGPVADGPARMTLQLPPDVRHFADRTAERTRVLRAAAERAPGAGRPLVVSIHGVHGVGKTALGVHLARRLAADGTYFVRYTNLDDHRRDGGTDLTEALGELLASFTARDLLEKTLGKRQRQYWEQTGDRRVLVILDNARTGSEVDALLPASSDSVVLALGQEKLHGIKGGADLELAVGPLGERDAEELLLRTVTDARLAADPSSVTALARVCGGLPAALEVAAQWLRSHETRRMSRIIAELARRFEEKGVPLVEAVWDATYEELGPSAALLYRLLAASPGPDISPDAATALLGRGQDTAEDALDELVRCSLLTAGRDGRLRMHDLLRAHAARCARRARGEGRGVESGEARREGRGTESGEARRDGPGTETDEARRRIVRWYLRQAQRADALAAGPRLVLAERVEEVPGAPDVLFTGAARAADGAAEEAAAAEGGAEAAQAAAKDAAYRWLERERRALYACVRTAYAHGLDDEAWALCEPLLTHFVDHPHYLDVTDAFRTGRDAALRAGRARAAIRLRCQLARPLWEQGDHEAAAAELDAALRAADAVLGEDDGDRKLRASVLDFHGQLRFARGQWVDAAAYFETSRRIHVEIGNEYGALLQTYQQGKALAGLGELDRAAELLRWSHAEARRLNRSRMTKRTGFELGRVLSALGHHDEARPLYEASLAAARARHSLQDELRVLDALTALAEATGDTAAAGHHREAARTLRERGGGLAGTP